jgi:hypothetical protein
MQPSPLSRLRGRREITFAVLVSTVVLLAAA